MSNYSKLIAAVAGNLIAILLVYLGTKGLATCTAATADVDQVCTVAGFTTAQITGAVMLVLNAIFVHFAPANKTSTS
jgi:hypothetical protein